MRTIRGGRMLTQYLFSTIIDTHPSRAYPLCNLIAPSLRLGSFSVDTEVRAENYYTTGVFYRTPPEKGRGMIPSRHIVNVVIALSLLVLGAAVMPSGAAAQYVPRIDKEQLKSILGQPGLVIVDVRRPVDWNASSRKIRGAVREDPQAVERWAGKYPKNKTIVFY